jgi:hypothetical protein
MDKLSVTKTVRFTEDLWKIIEETAGKNKQTPSGLLRYLAAAGSAINRTDQVYQLLYTIWKEANPASPTQVFLVSGKPGGDIVFSVCLQGRKPPTDL